MGSPEVSWAVLACLEHAWSVPWVRPGVPEGVLEVHVEASWGNFEASWENFGRVWDSLGSFLGAFWEHFWNIFCHLEQM